ncbi:MFS transporter [Pseudonocardia kunmingensis]|uniref:AAHS family benzoate transporter-like MFS transporter n=1 Tax=Pseudonocardia kunmingensis TaxID=630975 RepID=A0A543CXQ0_9PSEU|nr:aromatic acid/H+ symport family MFS transporter [Pseudonocardia kunmingensis]TQM01892.1 AAHS family benzoate transporter-like MFS transporter [Pseudonocardia kunmingensis]
MHATGTTWYSRRPGALVIAICFATVILDGYDLVVYGAIVPALLDYEPWGLDAAAAGLIGSLALVGMAVGALCSGWLTDRLGRRRLVLAAITWFSAATALCAVAPNAEVFGLLRFVAGIGLGGVLPSAIALTVEFAPPNRRQLYNSIIHAGYSVGGVICAAVAIWLLPTGGFRVLLLVGAAPWLILFPIALRWLPESPSWLVARGRLDEARELAIHHGLDPETLTAGATTSKVRTSEIFGRYRRWTILFVLISFCGLLLSYGVGTWLPQIMRQAGYPLGSAISFLLVLNLGNVIGTLLIASVADRIGSRRAIPIALTVGAVSLVLLSIPLPQVLLYVLVTLLGFGAMGSQILVNGFVAASYPSRIRASGLGFVMGVGRLGGIAGPYAVGLLITAELGFQWNFWFFAAFAVIAVVLTLSLGRHPDERTPTTGVPGRVAG